MQDNYKGKQVGKNSDARYHKQSILKQIGISGQEQINNSSVLIVGAGALGCFTANLLARSGVGKITIVDRDLVEESNLQRQILYSESDIGLPKATVAKEKIQKINSQIIVESHVDDFRATNAEKLSIDSDLLIDGLDNLETRYLLNDLAVKTGKPYLYGGAVSTYGLQGTFLPHPKYKKTKRNNKINWKESDSTPCFRCIFTQTSDTDSLPTCDTSGILSSIISTVASLQYTDAIKLITQQPMTLSRSIHSIDIWNNTYHKLSFGKSQISCPLCNKGEFAFLNSTKKSSSSTLCGQDAVQVIPKNLLSKEMYSKVKNKLKNENVIISKNDIFKIMLNHESRIQKKPIKITIFQNGRAVIHGTTEPNYAESIYKKYVGQ